MNPYTLYPLTAPRLTLFGSDVSALAYNLIDGIVGVAAALDRRVTRWNKRRQAISELSGLSDHLLRDIGVSRGEIPYVVDSMLDAPEAVRVTRPYVVAGTGAHARADGVANDNVRGIAA